MKSKYCFTTALVFSLLTAGSALAQDATPPAAPTAALDINDPTENGIDLSSLITPENIALVSEMLKNQSAHATGNESGDATDSPQSVDLGALLKGLGENGDLNDLGKFITPESMAVIGAMLNQQATVQRADESGDAAEAKPGGMIFGMQIGPDGSFKLLGDAAQAAQCIPAEITRSVQKLAKQLGECDLGHGKVGITIQTKIQITPPAGTPKKLKNAHSPKVHAHAKPAAEVAPSEDADRTARIDALLKELRTELLAK